MHWLGSHMDRRASRNAGGVAFVIGPQNHRIIAAGQPCVRGIRPVAYHHPVPKVPTRGADPPANSRLKTDANTNEHIGGGSQHGGAQRPGYRPAPILVAADSGWIGPRLAVYINPGSQVVTALAKAGRVGAQMRGAGQLRLRHEVVGAIGREGCRAAVIQSAA